MTSNPAGESIIPVDDCPAEEAAIYAAVANTYETVASMTILPAGFLCGHPFYAGTCPLSSDFPIAAYVTFIGTAKVAALTLTPQIGATVPHLSFFATVVAFEVPPTGWTGP